MGADVSAREGGGGVGVVVDAQRCDGVAHEHPLRRHQGRTASNARQDAAHVLSRIPFPSPFSSPFSFPFGVGGGGWGGWGGWGFDGSHQRAHEAPPRQKSHELEVPPHRRLAQKRVERQGVLEKLGEKGWEMLVRKKKEKKRQRKRESAL